MQPQHPALAALSLVSPSNSHWSQGCNTDCRLRLDFSLSALLPILWKYGDSFRLNRSHHSFTQLKPEICSGNKNKMKPYMRSYHSIVSRQWPLDDAIFSLYSLLRRVRQHGAERSSSSGGIKEIRRVGISYFRRNHRPVSDTRVTTCVKWRLESHLRPSSSSSGSPILTIYFWRIFLGYYNGFDNDYRIINTSINAKYFWLMSTLIEINDITMVAVNIDLSSDSWLWFHLTPILEPGTHL